MLLSEIKAVLKREETEGTQKRFDTRIMVGSVIRVRLYHVKFSAQILIDYGAIKFILLFKILRKYV